jgi:thioredoxin-related protein
MKRMTRVPYFLLISIVLLSILSMSSARKLSNEEPTVNWMSFEQAVQKSKTEKRKIFIDVYTTWCGWCKVMDKNTFNDPKVAKLLNEKFYAVKLNAEQREDINYNGHTFKFVASGNSGYHQLAASLLNNQMSYPTVVFLDEEFSIIKPLAGYVQAPEFHKIAQFIGGGHYKTEKWEDFQNSYKSPY